MQEARERRADVSDGGGSDETRARAVRKTCAHMDGPSVDGVRVFAGALCACACVCVDSLAYIGSRKAAREGSKTHATHLPLPHSHLRLSLFSSQTGNGRRVKSIVSDRPAVCPRTRETRLAAAKRASETANDNYSLNFSTDSVREIPNQPNQSWRHSNVKSSYRRSLSPP